MYARHPMNLDNAIAIAPSIAATEQHNSRSDRYAFVPTTSVLEALMKEDFQIYGVTQANARREDKRDYTKHMIRLRRGNGFDKAEAPELVLINSHDGSSRYVLMAGMIRFACANGLILGDKWDEVRVKHSGDVVNDVIEGTYEVMDQFGEIADNVNRMRSIELTRAEQGAFVESALPIRFNTEDAKDAPVTVDQVLRPRRYDDSKNNLWATFNATQEALVRGGLHGRKLDANGRVQRRRTREVKAIDQNVKLNKALWTLAEKMAEIKG